ncbi:MAG: hypothetical protein B6229_00360 [Spirochaetaceae bacterium 4572_7]|nr:MAG: hypothetical protein B6229_00360 [Spirochaetaceae bacterium 4572_7]
MKGRKKKPLPSYIGDEEFLSIMKFVPKQHHRLAFILGYSSGLRVSEVVNLKKEDIDLKSKRIFIKEAKGGKDRVVPLPKRFPASYLKLLPLKCGARALQMKFRLSVKKAGIKREDLHFHSLRHSFAVRCMEKGIPLNQIQVMLGHESISTTSVYLKINPKDALDNYEKLW